MKSKTHRTINWLLLVASATACVACSGGSDYSGSGELSKNQPTGAASTVTAPKGGSVHPKMDFAGGQTPPAGANVGQPGGNPGSNPGASPGSK